MYKFNDMINPSWRQVFNNIDHKIFDTTETNFNNLMEQAKLNNVNIYPVIDNIFAFTHTINPENIDVFLLGQDPYHGTFKVNDVKYPQAIGHSFDIPQECPTHPPSLVNICKNLVKFGHIDKYNIHQGNMNKWHSQNILCLNAALTVQEGIANSHANIWSDFTDELIRIISENKQNIVFILLGKFAHMKKESGIIKNQDKHFFSISSHPSGYSAASPYRNFGSFNDVDHFGFTNACLVELNKPSRNWNIV